MANLALVLVIWLHAVARADQCVERPNLCSHLHPNTVAFIARAISASPLSEWQEQVTLRIEEPLWGSVPRNAIFVAKRGFVRSSANQSWLMLSYPLAMTPGQSQRRYQLGVDGCDIGRRKDKDHEWVKQLRTFTANRTAAKLHLQLHSKFIQLKGFAFSITGEDYRWKDVSTGALILIALPPGPYSTTLHREHYGIAESDQQVVIPPGSCSTWPIEVMPHSSISGKISIPAPYTDQTFRYQLQGEVHTEIKESTWTLLRQQWNRIMGWNDPYSERVYYSGLVKPDGTFHEQTLPGIYRLSIISTDEKAYRGDTPLIPSTFYPGAFRPAEAEHIEVKSGQQIRDIHFQVPNYGPTRRLEFILRETDGKPAANQVVAFRGVSPDGNFAESARTQKLTDADGRVTFKIWPFLDYRLEFPFPRNPEDRKIPAGTAPVSRTIVLPPRHF